MKRKRIEQKIHKAFVEWCYLNWQRWPQAAIEVTQRTKVGGKTVKTKRKSLAFFHVPNGGARDAVTGAVMKAMGVRPGVLDMWLPVPSGDYCGLVLEFKAPGGRLSAEQNDWIEFLSENRWCVRTVDSLKAAIWETELYLLASTDDVD